MSKIFVALSGGVDSSVVLALLKQEGHDVTGVYFKTYKPDGNKEYCRQQGMDAQAVCKHLNVPFKVYDLEEEYKQKVFNYMIDGYKAGVTPNPDIMCNKEIKFGIFAHKAFEQGAEMIATGHYANVQNGVLYKAKDQNKDQTYFLSQVHSKVLSRTIFPLGNLLKSEVRVLAEKFKLPTAKKKESQGICFIGQEIDIKNFLKKYIPEQVGVVLNIKGEAIGTHKGAKFATVGERHGFTILPKYQSTNMPRLFVIKRDIKHNVLTVGTKEELEEYINKQNNIIITNCNWFKDLPKQNEIYESRIRHRGELYPCKVKQLDTDRWQINFIHTPYAPAVGQFAALYKEDVCLGGGVII